MSRITLWAAIVALGLISSAPPPAMAQSTERVRFDRGASSTTLRGQIRGYEFRDYVVGARAGQTMSVDLRTQHGATYFNVLAPWSRDVAMFVGSSSGKIFTGRLPDSGDYRIRVYMMRSAARRNEVANYRLSIEVFGRGGGGYGASDGYRPGGGYGPAGAGARPVDISDLVGMDGVTSFDVMIERGFRNVDSISSGNAVYGIYFQPRTRQCVQVTTANRRVVDARDIRTHPKCR